MRYSVGLASAWGLPGRRRRSARACQLAHAFRGRSTQQTVTPEDQSYASKSWLVGSLAHLVAPIVKRWAGRLTTYDSKSGQAHLHCNQRGQRFAGSRHAQPDRLRFNEAQPGLQPAPVTVVEQGYCPAKLRGAFLEQNPDYGWCVPWCNRRWEVFTVAAIGGPHSIVIVRKSGSAVIESGNTQPQRRLRSAGECHSAGLGSFGFRFYCIQMGICLVCARFLSITFQRLALG